MTLQLRTDTQLLPTRTYHPYTDFDQLEDHRYGLGTDYTVNIVSAQLRPDDPTELAFIADTWTAYRQGRQRILLGMDSLQDEYKWGVLIDPEESTLYAPGLKLQASKPTSLQWHPFVYPTDQILLFHILQRFNAILMHSVGFTLDGKGIVCVGKSGAGKSTLARIAERKGARVLSDDRIIIRRMGGEQRLYGTPWPGEGEHARNEGHPLSHLLFLVQSDENKLVPLSSFEAAQRLMPVCSIPWYDEKMVTDYFAIIDRIVRDIPCAELHFTRSDHVLDVLNDLKA